MPEGCGDRGMGWLPVRNGTPAASAALLGALREVEGVGAAFECLSSDVDVTSATLETRNHPTTRSNQLDRKDHQVLQSLLSEKLVPSGFRITHDDKSERMLALADILAGARTDYLCGVDVEPFATLAHRVQHTVSVLGR